MKRIIPICILVILFQAEIQGQIIKGRIIDSKTGDPLAYVGIGIINTAFGTITDEKGEFVFDAAGEDLSSIVRISMTGYKPQKYLL